MAATVGMLFMPLGSERGNDMLKKWFAVLLMIAVLVSLVGVLSTSAAPVENDVVHIVQPGETLGSIALRYGVSMWDIAQANGIANPNYIYVGQRLVIPKPQSGARVHVVQYGETLLGIALRHGVSAWDIAQANGISNLNYIYVGQRLAIPGAAPTPRPSSPSRPAMPSQPTTWPGPWTGEYFDNPSLTGSPFVTRTDEAINFNWGYGPPAGNMPSNAFSVRWTGTFDLSEGTHYFYAQVDDGVRVYVDGLRIIDGWRDGSFRTYTAQQTLASGTHTFQIEFYDRIQVARIHFWWKAPQSAAASTSMPEPTTTPAPSTGWSAQFYNNVSLEGSPVAARQDAAIGFEWGAGSPMAGVYSDGFSARWTMTAHFDADTYRFCAMSDDGVRIYVDDGLVVNEWHGSNGLSYCGSHWVQAGNHEVKVEYYEDGGNALLYVWWEPH